LISFCGSVEHKLVDGIVHMYFMLKYECLCSCVVNIKNMYALRWYLYFILTFRCNEDDKDNGGICYNRCASYVSIATANRDKRLTSMSKFIDSLVAIIMISTTRVRWNTYQSYWL